MLNKNNKIKTKHYQIKDSIMKKALVLATALLLSLSANSFAQTETTEVSKERKERQYKGDREGSKMQARNTEARDSKKAAAKKQCAQKCNLNKEKIRECRKKNGAKKGESLNGKCVSEKAKACMKTCMDKHKPKGKGDKQTRNGEKKDRKDRSARQDRRAETSTAE
jgi:hypothetical protein